MQGVRPTDKPEELSFALPAAALARIASWGAHQRPVAPPHALALRHMLQILLKIDGKAIQMGNPCKLLWKEKETNAGDELGSEWG